MVRLRIRAAMEDLASNRMVDTYALDGPFRDGILPLATALAREIDSQARPFPTKSDQALQAFVKARASAYGEAEKHYERAVVLDPDFGLAYVAWADLLARRGDVRQQRRVLSLAAARGDRLDAYSRIRLELLTAEQRGDAASRIRALTTLARENPLDPATAVSLAQAFTEQHDFAAAASWYRKAAALEPDNPLVWNQLGYAEAFARKLDGAVKALHEYEKLVPDDANPLDSLGDVHYCLGHFNESIKFYLQAFDKKPDGEAAFLHLWKAAHARLSAGDPVGADQLVARAVAARRHGALPFLEAVWLYNRGRREEAIRRMLAVGRDNRDVKALAELQLAAWLAAAGDHAQARRHAEWAVQAFRGTASARIAGICKFVAQPEAPPAEWVARAAREFPPPAGDNLRQPALAYALLLGGHFSDAVEVLTELHLRDTPASPWQWNVLLAWALIETGKLAQALPLLETYSIPALGFDGQCAFSFLAFPHLFELKARALEADGRGKEARRWRDVYQHSSAR